MKKIVFKSGKELEIDGISQSGNSLHISVLSKDVASIIETFSNPDNTAVMRYYVGIDLMCGYAGFKKLRGSNILQTLYRLLITHRRTRQQKADLQKHMWMSVQYTWRKLKQPNFRKG